MPNIVGIKNKILLNIYNTIIELYPCYNLRILN